MSATLLDTARQRVVRAVTREIASDALLLDKTVDAIVGMLDIELGEDARRALSAGGSGVVEASTMYAQGWLTSPTSRRVRRSSATNSVRASTGPLPRSMRRSNVIPATPWRTRASVRHT
jgi:hypothetical protein